MSEAGGGAGPGGLTGLLLEISSDYSARLTPAVVFAAALFAVGSLALRHEVTAMRANGLSPLRMLPPILIASALIAAGTFGLTETVLLDAARGLQDQHADGHAGATVQPGGSVWYNRGRTSFEIERVLRSSATLLGVRVFELNPKGQLTRFVHAEEVTIGSDGQWHLRNAMISRFEPAVAEARADVHRADHLVLDVVSESDLYRILGADISLLSLRELWDYIQDNRRVGDPVGNMEIRLHGRLSNPFLVMALALLAIPIGLRAERSGSLGAPALAGVTVLAGLFALQIAMRGLASIGALPAVIALWSMVLVFSGLGVWGVARIRG